MKRNEGGRLVVGPESVGYRITEEALVFGGDVATTTDYTVLGDLDLKIGDRTNLEGKVLPTDLLEFKDTVKSMLERIVDQMKTSPDDIPVVLVGGGAIVAPKPLRGASRVVKPHWSGIANAIGAATARVSGVVDSVEDTATRSKGQIMEDLSQRAVDVAVRNGALRESVNIAEMDSFPLQYIANKSRMIVKAVGDFEYSRTDLGELEYMVQERRWRGGRRQYTTKGEMRGPQHTYWQHIHSTICCSHPRVHRLLPT